MTERAAGSAPGSACPAAFDPATLLRTCVECGLCLPHCATWLATGDEVQSPRGRLMLLADLLESESPPAGHYLSFDQCIGCRACETACPSGVPYTLLDHGRKEAALRSRRDRHAAVPAWLIRRLDSRPLLRTMKWAAGGARATLRVLLGRRWRRRMADRPLGLDRLARLLGSLPRDMTNDVDLVALLNGLAGRSPADVAHRPADPLPGEPVPVVFFTGCANETLLPATSRRLLRLLEMAGCRITIPADQECCGALASHAGSPGRAARRHDRNRAALGGAPVPGARILVEAAGCGLELKNSLGDASDRVVDAVDFLSGLPLPALGPVPLRVVVHDPCHARHGQGIVNQPRELLDRIPRLERLEAEEAEVCCGSGGAWSLQNPELSRAIGRRKAEVLAATGAELVVTSNPGCLGQIADSLAVVAPQLPILPLTDLLWFAAMRGNGSNDSI